ncbi:MAG TPA: hypothetical protein VGZ03_03310 [Acidimicrobiales bacterium]|nr:hypothetical protein [Acidimicrobiales bacterium]
MSTVAVATPRSHRTRHTASVLLLVVVSILTPLVVTAGWAITTVTNTDRFVSTMSSLGTNPTITNYAGAQAAATLVTEVHLERQIAARLPKSAAILAPFLTTQFQTQLAKVFSTVFASQRFQAIWTAKLRLLHATFVAAMTSNGSKLSKAAQLGLDVTPQLLAAIDTLDQKGIHVFDPARKFLAGDKPTLVTLAQGKEFHEVQYYFHLATTLRWALWVGTLVLAIAAILLDPRRRRAGLWLGIGVACSCVVMLALLNTGKQYAISHSSAPSDVTNALVSTLTSWLRWELRAVVIVGLVAALVLWLTGPSRSARSLRRMGAKEGGVAGHAMEGVIGASATTTLETHGTAAIDWVGTYATVLAWIGVVVGGIVLAVWDNSLLSAAITILLVVGWFSAMVSIRRRVRSPVPAAPPPGGG